MVVFLKKRHYIIVLNEKLKNVECFCFCEKWKLENRSLTNSIETNIIQRIISKMNTLNATIFMQDYFQRKYINLIYDDMICQR